MARLFVGVDDLIIHPNFDLNIFRVSDPRGHFPFSDWLCWLWWIHVRLVSNFCGDNAWIT